MIHSTEMPNRPCTLMLLSNLAEPEWISISCSERLLFFVLCVKENKTADKNSLTFKTTDLSYWCNRTDILVKGNCFSFIWGRNTNHKTTLCQAFQSRHVNYKETKHLEHIFYAISPSKFLPKILLYKDSYGLYAIGIYWAFNRVKVQHFNMSISSISASHLCKARKQKRDLKRIIFVCENGMFILFMYVCDGFSDCPDNDQSDEIDCNCNNTMQLLNRNYSNTYDTLTEKLNCFPLYFKTKDGKCRKHYSESSLPVINSKKLALSFKCLTGKVIDGSLFNDLIPDCGQYAEDEPLLKSILLSKPLSSLCKPFEIPCIDGHQKCYNFSDICIFKLSDFGHLMPCRNGANLQNCTMFECNMMYKCQDSYCIYWNYVCDGKWDCPNGDDEIRKPACGKQGNCMSMYKCKGQNMICIELGNICDGIMHCLYGDDEMFCNLMNVICPLDCQCLLYAIVCQNIDHKILITIEDNKFTSVFLLNCSLTTIDKNIQSSTILKLPKNRIKEICVQKYFNTVQYLDLSFNSVEKVKRHCFSGYIYLTVVNVKYNKITHLFTESFYNLLFLTVLDLSNNPIVSISSSSLKNLPTVTLLNLSRITYKKIRIDLFETIKPSLVVINTNYYFSCISPVNSFCSLYPPWYISCSGILPNNLLKLFLLSILILIFCLNMTSILIHLTKFWSQKRFIVIAIGINVNDIFFAVYLFIIMAVDNFVEKVMFFSGEWKSHFLCFAAFATMLCFSIQSQLLLILMATIRLNVVQYPIESHFKILSFTLKCVLFTFFLSLGISALVTLVFKSMYTSISIDICIPFVDPTNSTLVTTIITWITMVTQTISSITIAAMNTIIYKTIKKSKTFDGKQEQSIDISVLIQLVITSVSNILCWVPSNIIYVAAMFMSAYPISLIIWSIVTILLINSIVNPLALILKFAKRD